MTRDVLVSVKGLHTAEETGEAEEIEVTSAGTFYEKNGNYYLLYEEAAEGSKEPIKNRLKLWEGGLELKKSGPVMAELLFEKNRKTTSMYHTPYGTMVSGIEVKQLEMQQSENLIEVKVEYALEMNYEQVSDSTIEIRIMAKNSGLFHLLK